MRRPPRSCCLSWPTTRCCIGTGGEWVTEASVPSLLPLTTLKGVMALDDNQTGYRLVLPGVAPVSLPPLLPGQRMYVRLRDAATGDMVELNCTTAGTGGVVFCLHTDFGALTQKALAPYLALAAGLPDVAWQTQDGVVFHFADLQGANGTPQRTLVVDQPGAHVVLPAESLAAGGMVLNVAGGERIDTGGYPGPLMLTWQF